MTAETPTKPEYLGLLNAISLGERNAGLYLKAWADATADEDLKRTLSLVAQRETTHGEVFRQRIERLGFSLQEKEDPKLAERIQRFGDPHISDVDKVRYSQRGQRDGGERDVIADLEAQITDSMDLLTQATMRWYLAEERDSLVLLRECQRQVLAKAGE